MYMVPIYKTFVPGPRHNHRHLCLRHGCRISAELEERWVAAASCFLIGIARLNSKARTSVNRSAFILDEGFS